MRKFVLALFVLLLSGLAPAQADVAADARKLAEDHYQAAVEGRRSDWIEYFLKQPREQYKAIIESGGHGCELEQLWIASQRRAKQGVRYEFLRVDRVEDDNVKLYFKRLKADGSPAGSPAPVIFHKEDGGWKIYNVRY